MISDKPIHRLHITQLNINAAATDIGVIYGLPAKWRVRKFTGYDASTSLAASIATLGLYTGAGGTGTALAALATMTALSGVSKCWDFSLAAGASSDYQTGSVLYVRCGIAHGGAATITVAIEIEELEQVKMDETIYLLTPLQCAEHGERLALLLAPAAGLSDGEFTASDLVAAGIAGKLSILVDNLSAPKSVLVADVGCSFRKRWLDILAVAGRVWPFWLNAEIVKMWARGLGCTEIRMECKSESRKRLFQRYGFVPLRQRMYMEV